MRVGQERKQQTKAVWGDRKTTLRLNVNCVAEQKVKVKEEEEEEKIKVQPRNVCFKTHLR